MSAPMAPPAQLVSAPLAPCLTALTEKQKHRQLAWNKRFEEYYARDWKAESVEYLSDKIIIKESEHTATNWKWYRYEAKEVNEMPSLRGHTLTDIGNDSMITIGDRTRKPRVDVYRITKQFDTFEKLRPSGSAPCCRFSHSAEYLPMIHSIFFFGGFDSQCNFNDARLLSLDTLTWHTMTHTAYIEYRAHHASATRLVQTNQLRADGTRVYKFECYIFGGMYCKGGPYRFHNDMFKFTFYDSDTTDASGGFFECEKLVNKSDTEPVKRSQSYSWIYKDTLYVFGGTTATHTLNDLWAFDLKTQLWSQIEYRGILGAPETYSIQPRNYRVSASRKPCYFDAEREQLIVIHYGALSAMQKKYAKYHGSMRDFKQDIANEVEEIDIDTKPVRKKGAIGMLQDTMKCRIFVFDMQSRQWFIKRNMNLTDAYDVPSKLVGMTRVVRIGEYLVQIGGGARGSHANFMKNMYLLKIPLCVWESERLLWIAHHKDNESILNKCPKDIITAVISFLREY